MRCFARVCFTFIPAIAAFALSAVSMTDAVAELPVTALERAVFTSENPSAGCVYPEAGCRAGNCNGQCDGNCGAGCDCGCSDKGCPLGLDAWLNGDSSMFSSLKDQPVGDCWNWSMGGELRYRYMDEQNRLRPPGPQRTRYDLWRFTPWIELGNGDMKFHVQAIDASTFGEDIAITPIDENRSDLLQYWGDFKIGEDANGGELRVRVGRQFLIYGSQHLVSNLDWGNTLRNFEGVRLYYSNENWNIDAFATRPVNGATGNIFRPRSFDNPDQSRWFSGVYTTYKGIQNQTWDFYWLWLDEEEEQAAFADGDRHTLGVRWAGTHPHDECGIKKGLWNWEFESGFQFGRDNSPSAGTETVRAGYLSAITGYTWTEVAMTPSIKGVFWWGSGDSDPTDGKYGTNSTLFPLGHAYWGIIDNLSGQNLLDYSLQASIKPCEKTTLSAAGHLFDKSSSADRIYNVAGVALGPAGGPKHIGTELDLIANYALSSNASIQSGYSWFWYGDAVDDTALSRDDAEQFYLMVTLGF
ncbi:MAG: alginate export family protein [Planctomycetota bacterium]|nr:alginate export family protein [Planctomycetota bacterium]MDA1249752.1 alginate export family protein [Planctomycetota bacterium]